MMESKSSVQLVNLGNPQEITILELAEKILELTKSKSKIQHTPKQEDDPIRRSPDISRAGQQLKWKPKVSLEDGLVTTIEYFRKKLKSMKNQLDILE